MESIFGRRRNGRATRYTFRRATSAAAARRRSPPARRRSPVRRPRPARRSPARRSPARRPSPTRRRSRSAPVLSGQRRHRSRSVSSASRSQTRSIRFSDDDDDLESQSSDDMSSSSQSSGHDDGRSRSRDDVRRSRSRSHRSRRDHRQSRSRSHRDHHHTTRTIVVPAAVSAFHAITPPVATVRPVHPSFPAPSWSGGVRPEAGGGVAARPPPPPPPPLPVSPPDDDELVAPRVETAAPVAVPRGAGGGGRARRGGGGGGRSSGDSGGRAPRRDRGGDMAANTYEQMKVVLREADENIREMTATYNQDLKSWMDQHAVNTARNLESHRQLIQGLRSTGDEVARIIIETAEYSQQEKDRVQAAYQTEKVIIAKLEEVYQTIDKSFQIINRNNQLALTRLNDARQTRTAIVNRWNVAIARHDAMTEDPLGRWALLQGLIPNIQVQTAIILQRLKPQLETSIDRAKQCVAIQQEQETAFQNIVEREKPNEVDRATRDLIERVKRTLPPPNAVRQFIALGINEIRRRCKAVVGRPSSCDRDRLDRYLEEYIHDDANLRRILEKAQEINGILIRHRGVGGCGGGGENVATQVAKVMFGSPELILPVAFLQTTTGVGGRRFANYGQEVLSSLIQAFNLFRGAGAAVVVDDVAASSGSLL